MEITLGYGNYRIVGCERNGRDGIAITKEPEPHPVGFALPTDPVPEPWVPTENDVVIWLDNIGGARVLQDQINIACLRLNGFEVVNKEG